MDFNNKTYIIVQTCILIKNSIFGCHLHTEQTVVTKHSFNIQKHLKHYTFM